jgi:hypothetical protein
MQDHTNLTYLADFIARRRQRHKIRILFSGIMALFGAGVLPLLLILLITGCLSYLIILVTVVFSAGAAWKSFLVMASILTLVYLILLAISFRNAWTLRWYFFSDSERRPSKDWLNGVVQQPLFYAPLGIDLLDDDAPQPMLLRLTARSANALAKFLLQWKLSKSLVPLDSGRCPELLKKIISVGGSCKMQNLLEPDQALASLHDPITYLLVLDILSINELWTNTWISSSCRERLLPHAVDSRNIPAA